MRLFQIVSKILKLITNFLKEFLDSPEKSEGERFKCLFI